MSILGTIVRFVVSAFVLLIVSALLPGIAVSGFTGALVAAVVIAVLGFVVESILGRNVSPRSRGLVGFISAVGVIWVTGIILPGLLRVNIFGAILAAFVIGLVDAIIPTEIR